MVLDGKFPQEYPVNTGVSQGSILGPTLFLQCTNDLPDDVICDIAIFADDTTLYSKCDDLWQQLELAFELESDQRDTVDWGKKWLVDFNAGKTQLVLFDWSNNTGSIDVKTDGSILEEKSSFKMLGLTKVNLLYLLYSTTRRCFPLHLIKQNCLLKTFVRTLMLMTLVSLYLFSLLDLT